MAPADDEVVRGLLSAGAGTAMKGRAAQVGRDTQTSEARCELVKPNQTPPATEVMKWLDGVLADPDLANAIEERMAEMEAEQDRVAHGEDGLRPGRDLPGTRRGTARTRGNRVPPNARRARSAPKRRPG